MTRSVFTAIVQGLVLSAVCCLLAACGDTERERPFVDAGRDVGSAVDSRTAGFDGGLDAQHGQDAQGDILLRDAHDGATPDQSEGGCHHPSVKKNCTNGWCVIPAGCFLMGSPTDALCRDPDETQHNVTLTRSFEISAAEVTQQAFDKAMDSKPSANAGCLDCPVETVTWDQAAAYCNTLSKAQELTACYVCGGESVDVSCQVAADYLPPDSTLAACPGYRLPTASEWEYAARAGSTTALHNGDLGNCTGTDVNANAVAWYGGNSGGKTHPVMQKQANAWGLYDMSGNVFEWTADGWLTDWGSVDRVDPWVPQLSKSRRIRGGSFPDPAWVMRLANRASRTVVPRTLRYRDIGFRCVRSLPKD